MVDSFTNNELEFIDIYEQYADQASFLWLMHTIAVDQPHYSIGDLARLEQRIDAQLSGLMGNIDLSWKICQKALEMEAGGELFVASIIAFRSRDQNKIQSVVEMATVSEDCLRGLVYALAWLPGKMIYDWVKKFFTSKELSHKLIAMEVCNLRQENPENFLKKILQRDDCLQHINLYVSSLRSVGTFKRYDLLEYVDKAMENDDKKVKFWATRTAILLGEESQVNNMAPYIFEAGGLQREAIQIAFRAMPVSDSRKWVAQFGTAEKNIRTIIIVVGVIGDPRAVEWLLHKMDEIDYTRIAAESFCMITGLDLEQMEMTVGAPENYESLPNDDAEDENVAMHDDENLPWPDVLKLNRYWHSIKGNYKFGSRYLLGKPVELDALKMCLPTAYQRQRHAIAYEIALLEKNETLINTRGLVNFG